MSAAVLMREIAEVIGWIGHGAPALPMLAWVVLAWALRRKIDEQGYQIAVAFFVSAIVDLVAWRMGEAGQNNHVLMHIAAPLQLGLLMYAIRPDLFVRTVGAMLAITAGVVLFHLPLDRPELAVRTIVGLLVAWVAYKSTSPYRWPVVLYCGLTVPLLWAWTALTTNAVTLEWLLTWGSYQAVRVTALGWMMLVLLMQAYPRLGAIHGRERGTNDSPAGTVRRAGKDGNDAGGAVRGHRVDRAVRAGRGAPALAPRRVR